MGSRDVGRGRRYVGTPQMTTAWIVWRIVKFAGLTIFAAGIAGAATSPNPRSRFVLAHWVAPLGLVLTWTGGYGLLKLLGRSLLEPWILVSWGASFVAWHGAVLASYRGAFRRPAAALVVFGFFSALGAMVLRETSLRLLLVAAALPAVLATLMVGLGQRAAPEGWEVDERYLHEAVPRWFLWIARAEGVSLTVLLLIYVPLKHLVGINLDGGQGWFGWVHGALMLLYLQAMVSAARYGGWSRGTLGLAFVASLVPFGPFWLERRLAT